MKTNCFHKKLLIICALGASAFGSAHPETIKSTYIGPADGSWGNPANWSPAIVPNNGGDNSFATTIANVFLTLDLDVTVNRLTLARGDGNNIIVGGTAPLLFCLDHDFTSAHTKVGNGGIVAADAESKDVTVDLGELADFSGTTLNTGYVYAVISEPGRTATLKFNGANIVTNTAGIELIGVRTLLTDENGADALAHFRHNAFDGYFDLEVGRNFTTEGAFVNEGGIAIFASDPGSVSGDVTTTLTINGNYTGVGYPLDPNTDGLLSLTAPGPMGDARMLINGALTNYDSGTQTLHKSYFGWEAAGGASAVTRVLGGSKPLDIVTSEASLNLFGPNTGFRDKFGNDALRNLAVSARLLIGDRNFTTANSFTSTSRLSVFGDCRFTVSGHLTIRNGFFEVSPLTGYARNGDPGFPTTRYKSSVVTVRGNFNLPAPGILRFHVLDHEKTATVNVKGAAVFAGSLQAGVEKPGRISPSDSFTVLTAANITGQFSNVTNGGRVEVFGSFDQFGNPTGQPVGTFLVNYDKTSLTLSDFQRN
jgi:hypothetical protein